MPGSYTIKPIEAKLNSDAHFTSEMSAFCSFTFGSKQFASETNKPNGNNPTWSSSVTILSNTDTNSTDLRLDLVDKEHPDTQDYLGNCSINLKEIEYKGQLRNWYPLRHNDQDIGEILLDSTFEEDLSKKGQSTSDSSTANTNRQSTSQADASEKSRVNEAKDRRQIAEGDFVSEGMMAQKPGQPFTMSNKQKEMYNNNPPQGMNENMEQPKWTKRSEVNDTIANPGNFTTGETWNKQTEKGFGDNIGTNPNPISNNKESENPIDDSEGKKPAQQTSTNNELNNQGSGKAAAKGGLAKTDVYSEAQSHIGSKMNLGLIEKQNQPQKTGSGQNASAEGLHRDASPSKEHKTTEGHLSNMSNNDEKVTGVSQPQPHSKKHKKDKQYWDSKIQGLSSAEDDRRGGQSGANETKEVSSGMQSNPAGGSINQETMTQSSVQGTDLKKLDT